MRLFLLLLAPLLAQAQFTATLGPSAAQSFQQYQRSAEARIGTAARFGNLKPGDIQIVHDEAPDPEAALIHDWTAATLVAGASPEKVLAVLQNYDAYARFYGPDVAESRLLQRDGQRYRAYLKLIKRKALVAVLNTEYDVEYRNLGAGRWLVVSRSTRIQEVEYGHELPAGEDHGFLWRLNAYWLLEPRPQGLYIECRTLSLTRDIPAGLGWMLKPIVSGLPKDSLRDTLLATVKALH